METRPFRFRLFTDNSIGAYTVAYGTDQADAFASLSARLAPWEHALPLHGPSFSPQWFDGVHYPIPG